MSSIYEEAAGIALRVVKESGGFISFDDYDKTMEKEIYFYPCTWINGWGSRTLHKRNNDKMCAFEACKMGLIEQTEKGYKLT